MALELGVPVESLTDYQPHYNIAPTDMHRILRMQYENGELLPAKLGLSNSWAKEGKRGQNQRSRRDVDAEARLPRGVQWRRCVVPAGGFFEWTGPKGARQPFWFHRPDGSLLLFRYERPTRAGRAFAHHRDSRHRGQDYPFLFPTHRDKRCAPKDVSLRMRVEDFATTFARGI